MVLQSMLLNMGMSGYSVHIVLGCSLCSSFDIVNLKSILLFSNVLVCASQGSLCIWLAHAYSDHKMLCVEIVVWRICKLVPDRAYSKDFELRAET